MKKYIMSFVIIAVIAAVVMCSGCVGAPDQTSKLYSLNAITGSSGTSGGFLIGYGHIDEEAYYFYYLQDTDGAYHLMKADVGSSRIFMDTASDTAYVTKVDCLGQNSRSKKACSGYLYGYDFHVPPGTITIQFNGNVDRSVNGV
jgi:hypothetical protein